LPVGVQIVPTSKNSETSYTQKQNKREKKTKTKEELNAAPISFLNSFQKMPATLRPAHSGRFDGCCCCGRHRQTLSYNKIPSVSLHHQHIKSC
jgi:hypothetical protein